MQSDDSRSMSAFGANACLCAEYNFPIKHDASENKGLNLETLKDTIERFAGTHGFCYTMTKSPARRKTIKWLQFTCGKCTAHVASRRGPTKRRRIITHDTENSCASQPQTSMLKTLPVHSVRVRYAFADDSRTNLASYSLIAEQWAHCCGIMTKHTGEIAPVPAPAPAPAPTKTPITILKNLVDSRIELAVYVASTNRTPTPTTVATNAAENDRRLIATFVCTPCLTTAERKAIVSETMQAICDDSQTTPIYDVRVTAEQCKMVDDADASRHMVDRLLLRVFL